MAGRRVGQCWAGIVLVTAAVALPRAGLAANGAYAVDAADISELGSCKLESWLSAATNTDFSAVANPSCVVDLTRPVELSVLANRFRSDGEWGTTLAPKLKTNIAPTGVGRWGYSFLASATFDAMTGDNTALFAEIPATYRLSEVTRINLNAGLLWDRTINRQFLTYGIGYDWKFTDTLQFTAEMFGQIAISGDTQSLILAGLTTPSQTWPRFQTGLRYRPNDIFSVDIIYGRNITGENANWITLGTTIRFPPPKSVGNGSGHL